MSLAFVFPGQGSQSIGRLQGFDSLPVVRATFEEASDILGQNLWQMVTDGPIEELNQTVNTQPVMLTAGIAVYRAWNALNGTQPAFSAGHSLGEYTALVAAGALAFADALPLVRYRAQVMQAAVAEGVGGMAAILGLDDDAVRAVEFVRPALAIPMHYNTFPIIAANPDEFQQKVAAKGHGCRVMKYGESVTL